MTTAPIVSEKQSLARPDLPRCDSTAAWQALHKHYESSGKAFNVREAIAHEPNRFAHFAVHAPHIKADLSRNYWCDKTQALLLELAQQCQLDKAISAMFDGALLNTTEQRAAWHVLLRQPENQAAKMRAEKSPWIAHNLEAVWAQQRAFLDFAEQVRADNSITDIVNIGIGGSDLGPAVVVAALDGYTRADKRVHFVSNMDGNDLGALLRTLNPASTLFIVASKTFGTAETIANARSAKAWFLESHGVQSTAIQAQDLPHDLQQLMAKRFVGVTSNKAAASSFGIQTTFEFKDWVGGRFSLWSSIGLSIAIAIGAEQFKALLAGAHEMDEHFRTSDFAHNLPVRLALLDIWYRNFHGFTNRTIAPYSHNLRRLPAYLQQLEMESNGKGIDVHGNALPFATAPSVWGEAGTNGQHAYFQLLHQGAQIIPVEFIVVRQAGLLAHQHPAVLANAMAQARALTEGKHEGPLYSHCPGNRPSTTLVVERLDPHGVGALIALYEHRTFVAGALWGINSFDQWGVELGKTLAKGIQAAIDNHDTASLDATTQGMLGWLEDLN